MDTIHRNYGCSVLPAVVDSAAAENNIQHEAVQVAPNVSQEDSGLVVKLEPGTLELHVADITPSYSSSNGRKNVISIDESNSIFIKSVDEQVIRPEHPSLDIFSTAIASADINLSEPVQFNNEGNIIH